jgi:hypothetical protein
MTTTSIQDRVDALISSPVAQDRTQGGQSIDLETAAVVENIATTLLLNPRVVLYLANLARNQLVNLVSGEFNAVQALIQTINDLGNVTYSITDTTALSQAQEALLQLEDHLALDSAFAQYNNAVSKFLNSTIKKNVVGPSSDMKRPAAEAQQDLPSDLAALEAQHTQVLNSLSSLVVGVQNFQNIPLGFLLSGAVASRSRQDLDDIISSLEADPSGSQSRDVVTRLITSRAALKTLSTPPDISDPVISTTKKLPPGFVLSGASEVLAAQANTVAGPFELASGGLTVTVDGVTQSASPVLCEGYATMVGAPWPEGVAPWPVTIPANTHLFLMVGLDTVRVPLNRMAIPATMTLGDVLACINSVPGFIAREFLSTGRIQISATGPLSIALSCSEVMPAATSGVPAFFSNSAHALLGFAVGQQGFAGATAASITDFFNLVFGSLIQAQALTNGEVAVSAKTPKIGSSMSFSGAWAAILGLGSYSTQSNQVFLSGQTPDGSAPDPTVLVQVGDRVSTPTGRAVVSKTSSTAITLDSPLPTFSGPITVDSGLLLAWQALDAGVRSFLSRQTSNPVSRNLNKLDAAVAILAGAATPAQRSQAIQILAGLTAWLSDLMSSLLHLDSLVSETGALQERGVAEDLIDTLLAKNFDQAADLISSCKIAEFFNLDYQSMSYGGTLLKATSDLARTDLQFPNRSKDEGLVVGSSAGRSSLP